MREGVLEGPSELPLEGGEWGCAVSVSAAASGVGVNVTLQQLRLDAALGDFLALNPGSAADGTKAAVFSWTLSRPLQMSMPARDAFFVRLRVAPRTRTDQSTNGLGFKITYDTFGNNARTLSHFGHSYFAVRNLKFSQWFYKKKF